MQPNQIRKSIRNQRRQLSFAARKELATKITKQIIHSEFFSPKNLAFYLANDGEVCTNQLIEKAWQRHKNCYLPYLTPCKHNRLWFIKYQENDLLKKNYFGIEEPELHTKKKIPSWCLSTVFVPLVAFDKAGGRLGMGGGFYDRTFAFLKETRSVRQSPTLVGLAYEFQQIDSMNLQPWDVTLDAIVTEEKIYRCG